MKFARVKELGIRIEEKQDNHTLLSEKYPSFTFIEGDITNDLFIKKVFEKYKPSVVCHLAAQAGVR